jgi:uncharacterized protein (TIGR02145 family)
MNPHALLSAAALFAVPALALDVSLSGTVTDLSGNILSGAGISLVASGNATSTNASGAWSIPATPTGIAVQLKSNATVATKHLVLDGNRIRLRFDGVDAAGRQSNAAVGAIHESPLRTVNDGAAARSSDVAVDTLLYSWKGRVRARVGIASLAAGNVGTQAIDTSTSSTDIPWKSKITYGTLTDARDGQVYKTVTICTQTWMAQNLNYAVDSSWCYTNRADSCVKYGRLYQWAAAMDLDTSFNSTLWNGTLPHQGACPSGWHLPSDAEWSTLVQNVDSATSATNLESTSGWNVNSGADAFGFRVLPAGDRTTRGGYEGSDYETYFYSSSEKYAANAWYRIFYSGGSMYRYNVYYKWNGFSLRCLEN